MKMTLGKTGLMRFFEGNIFSTSEVERGKPHPDIYLHAARSMGVDDPARCAVVEDSPIGVTGAVAAGMQRIRLRRTHARRAPARSRRPPCLRAQQDLPDLTLPHSCLEILNLTRITSRVASKWPRLSRGMQM